MTFGCSGLLERAAGVRGNWLRAVAEEPEQDLLDLGPKEDRLTRVRLGPAMCFPRRRVGLTGAGVRRGTGGWDQRRNPAEDAAG
jgi:hypothetical protein